MSVPSERLPSKLGWRPAAPARHPVLLINPRSGDGRATRVRLAERAYEHGVEAVTVTPGQSLELLARDAVSGGADALGMAGGDGSLAEVAAVALEHGVPFVCIPAGTRNHFALDLGIARHDVVGALRAFTDGRERWIDVATVNGRLFLNNVSLGIYGDAVRQPSYRQAKLHTLLATAREVLGSAAPAPPLRLVDDLGEAHEHPAVVLVSNNPYALEPPPVAATRPRLDGARLGILVLDRPRSAGSPPARAWSAPALEVHAADPVHAGIDGEAVELEPWLRFAIRPAAMRVRISAQHPGVSPSGRLALRRRGGVPGRSQ
jgi:diacylglycerol kinase family enzyme